MPKNQLYPSFWLLALAIFFVFILIVGFLWLFNIFGTSLLVTIFFFSLSVLLTIVFIILIAGFFGILFLLRKKIVPHIFHLPMVWTVNYFLGFVVKVGQVFGLSREKLQLSYITLTNNLVKNLGLRFPAESILVLAPHCIQETECPHRVTQDLNNCSNCGRCQIDDLTKMQREIGFYLAVVTGGTGARQIVNKIRPRAIVAIACERDLMSGIQDVFPRPVLGVVNIRPHGPCFNTEVDWTELETAIKSLCSKKKGKTLTS